MDIHAECTVKVKEKVKFSLEEAMKVQMGSREVEV
jgi:hypothetical protein